MNHRIQTIAWLSAWCLVACAPATRVILLPERSGHNGAVEVKTGTGNQLLSKPYQTADVDQDGRVVGKSIDPIAVMERYGRLLAQMPQPGESFVLHFETGGTQLTADSQAMLPAIAKRLRARQGGEITVTGHTDRVGLAAANDALSLQRAHAVRDALIAQGCDPNLVDAVGRGEREPLIPTPDEVAEPQNRRVDIWVH